MNTETLKQIRNILLRTTLISLLLTWFMAALTFGLWDTWTGVMSKVCHVPAAEFGPLIGNWFALIKFYFIFVLLAPALALHWEIKKSAKKA